MKILLAMDDSKFSEAALQMVIAQHRPREAEVRVVHVLEAIEIVFPPMATEYSSGIFPAVPLDVDKVRKKRLQQGQELVAAASEKLRAAGFKVDTAVRDGDTRADVIVVGSHGRKGLDRFLLGSVSDFVARHARCSVEIVRMPLTGLQEGK